MGRAVRWLKGLFFGVKKKDKEAVDTADRRGQRERHSVGGLCDNPGTIPPNISMAEAAWLSSFYTEEREREQSKHAIAVAAASAAAADAAVAAAQAAAAVVRLTSQGRSTLFFGGGGGGGGHDRWAAVKIQANFRGYLARKALRALRGLVKLQAAVRGYLVRKQATAAFLCMQSLFRAQATVRSRRGLAPPAVTEVCTAAKPPQSQSTERSDDQGSEYTASFHSRRLSSSLDAAAVITATEGSPKIVEVDTGLAHSRPIRPRPSDADLYTEPPPLYPLPSRALPRLSIPEGRRDFPDPEGALSGDICRLSTTAHSTPRLMASCRRCGPSRPASPSSGSACGDNSSSWRQLGGRSPNYMASTESSAAKLRAQSAPRQRPETKPKRRFSLDESMGSRSSLSGVWMQRACSRAQVVDSFKNAIMGKLERPSEFGKEVGERI